MIVFVLTELNTVIISQSDGLTIITTCQGWRTEYTCVLNSNINSNDVQWYRFIRDTSTTVRVVSNGANINFVNTDGNTTLTINDAQQSYNGYYWVNVTSQIFCNASFTVTTSTYICK